MLQGIEINGDFLTFASLILPQPLFEREEEFMGFWYWFGPGVRLARRIISSSSLNAKRKEERRLIQYVREWTHVSNNTWATTTTTTKEKYTLVDFVPEIWPRDHWRTWLANRTVLDLVFSVHLDKSNLIQTLVLLTIFFHLQSMKKSGEIKKAERCVRLSCV